MVKDIVSTKSNPKAIDMFSGCGGVTQGLKQAGFAVIGAFEIDLKAIDTYKLNHPEVFLFDGDVRSSSSKLIKSKLNIKTKELDLLTACPPCQGFSRLRNKNKSSSSDDERNNLIFEVLRLTKDLLPKHVMLENVPQLAKDKKFDILLAELTKLGYTSCWKILDAADFGVPQRRKRLILISSRVCEPTLAIPKNHRISVRDAISSLPLPSESDDSLHNYKVMHSAKVKEIISLIPKNGGSRSDLDEIHQLNCHINTKGFHDVYGRISWDDVSPTITSGCTNPSKGRFIHPDQNRAITLREAALLQGFPLNYRFLLSHGKESISLMIGNALPVPLIEAQANHIATFKKTRKKPTTQDK